MHNIIEIKDLTKTYQNGFQALKSINLNIQKSEILALLGPNGAGKTTLINTICGINNPSSGSIKVAGYDIITDYRQTRSLIGLVPQEIYTDSFETVWATLALSRGLFNKPHDPNIIEQVLRDLSLWEKRDSHIRTLSGGMKRRVLIAKALAHEPDILFLDEPTAGVDVELRQEMWRNVERLRAKGVTIILTTHYIEEAEAIADRIGVINDGKVLLIEEKNALMQKLGKKEIIFDVEQDVSTFKDKLHKYNVREGKHSKQLIYTYDSNNKQQSILMQFIQTLIDYQINISDMHSAQTSLEDIFITLLKKT